MRNGGDDGHRINRQAVAPPNRAEREGSSGALPRTSGRAGWARWLGPHNGAAPDPGRAFDELAKDLARGLSRREALRRLAGGLGGALLASLGFGKLSLSPAAADPARDACLLGCDNTYNTCTLNCENQYQAQIGAAEAAFRACKAHCPTSGPNVDACNHACEGPHSQATGAAEQTLSSCLTTCTSHRNTCAGGCPGGAGGSGNGEGNSAGGQSSGGKYCYPGSTIKCTGCCESGGCIDVSIQDSTKCGSGGDVCHPCPGESDECIQGNCCVPDTSGVRCCPKAQVCFSLAGHVCCEHGCCKYGEGCLSVNDDQHCGQNGGTCQDCTKLGAGNGCVGGGCHKVCGSDRTPNCDSGCCNGNSCIATANQTKDKCGLNGAACMPCPQGETCVNGKCQPTACVCPGPPPGPGYTCCCPSCCAGGPPGIYCPPDGSGSWVNLQNDNGSGGSLCGSCDTVCSQSAACVGGHCVCPDGSACYSPSPCDPVSSRDCGYAANHVGCGELYPKGG